MHAGIPAAMDEYLRFKDDTAHFIVPGQDWLRYPLIWSETVLKIPAIHLTRSMQTNSARRIKPIRTIVLAIMFSVVLLYLNYAIGARDKLT